MKLEVDLLGRFAVRSDGRVLDAREFGGRLAQRLVRVLVLHRGQVVTRDALIDALWGEHLPADPAANLNVLVNRARRALGRPDLIETVAGGYAFSEGADVTVDVEQFGAHAQTARDELRQGRPGRALAAARSALELWHGDPLPEDAYADWALHHRDRLERVHQETFEVGAAAALDSGDVADALELAAAAAAGQPLREVAHLLRVRALAAAGDVAGALAVYDVLRHRLADDLGIDPSREATELHGRLLRGERLTDSGPRPTTGSERVSATTAVPFVGRERELASLRDVGARTRVGLLSGRSGSGKSRLLTELIARSNRSALGARAVLPERDMPWSLARALLRSAMGAGVDPRTVLTKRSLAALVDILPEVEDEGAHEAVVDAQSRRALAVESSVRLVAAAGDAVIVVDDLQWADASSLDLLAVLVSRLDDVAMVLGYRPEEVVPDGEVSTFLTGLAATTSTLQVDLGPLDAADIESLVPDAEFASTLARSTDGTPFAVLEVIRSLEGLGALQRRGAGWQPASPDVLARAQAAAIAGQRRSVAVRAGRQPRAYQELLALLALLGRSAPAVLLADAVGATSADVVVGMNDLARAELVRHDAFGWAVAHDLVGEAVRDRIDPVERARLHQQLARALETDTADAGERARHLEGAGDRPAASVTYAQAARHRLEHFADREAERLAQAGLALEPRGSIRADLLEIRAETTFRAGSLADARHDLRAALTLAERGTDRARLLSRLAALASGAEDLMRAANLADMALAEARDDPGARARALAVAAIIDMNLDRPQRAEARYAEALALFQKAGDARGVADILDARAMATFLGGDIRAGIIAFDQVAQLFVDAGDLRRAVTPRSTRGHGLVFAGAPQAGLADTEQAHDLACSLGSPEGQAYAQWHRSEALTACGRADEAAQAAAEALTIAERLGHRGWAATALRALGIAREAQGDLIGAAAALRRSVTTSERLPLFFSWAHARLGLVLLASGDLDEAEHHVRQALALGPPLGHYEARLAACELAAVRGVPETSELIASAIDLAARGGHQVSTRRLVVLRDR